MQLTINTTADQDIALAALNLQSNPDGQTSDEEFTTSLLQDFVQSLTNNYTNTQLNSAIQAFKDSLAGASLADISAAKDSLTKGVQNPGGATKASP
jgi:hypothetical protein